jgi:tRNA A37 N6-isopentenylltransferase MiaA
MFPAGDKSDSCKRQKLDDVDDTDSPLNALETPELYARLQQADPERAEEIHPNERRKIMRSLIGKKKLS